MNPVADFYVVAENSFSDDLLIFVNHLYTEPALFCELSFFIFYEGDNNQCSFHPVNGKTCNEELTKLMKILIAQVEEDSIQRHQRNQNLTGRISVHFHALDHASVLANLRAKS